MSQCSICRRAVPPESRLAGPARPGTLARILARDRLIVALALIAAAGLAWWWLIRTGMPSMPAGPEAMAPMVAAPVWTPAYLFSAFIMWALMMVAMMLPSASPMILLHARFARSAGRRRALADTAVFALTYLAIWTVFSAMAAVAQTLLVADGVISAMTLTVGNRAMAGSLLVLAGLYQLSPLKQACLETCRSPLSFMMRLWRPGARGALRLGLAHGLYCLGCCWALMLLLFVGGVMSIAWIAALALLVLLEKLAPASLRKAISVLLMLAGAWLALGKPIAG
jgi:predicted metal-binding membrane protein